MEFEVTGCFVKLNIYFCDFFLSFWGFLYIDLVVVDIYRTTALEMET